MISHNSDCGRIVAGRMPLPRRGFYGAINCLTCLSDLPTFGNLRYRVTRALRLAELKSEAGGGSIKVLRNRAGAHAAP